MSEIMASLLEPIAIRNGNVVISYIVAQILVCCHSPGRVLAAICSVSIKRTGVVGSCPVMMESEFGWGGVKVYHPPG